MLQLEPEPTDSGLSSTRSSPVPFEGTTNLRDAQTVLRAAHELTRCPDAGESTLQPADIEDATILPQRYNDETEEVPEEVQEEEEDAYAEDYEEFDDEQGDEDLEE